jgi:hypothetical protein
MKYLLYLTLIISNLKLLLNYVINHLYDTSASHHPI